MAALLLQGQGVSEPWVDRPWLGALGSHFIVGFNRVSYPQAVFVASTFVVVTVYCRRYLEHHLASTPDSTRRARRFYSVFTAFFSAMMVVLAAGDLLLLFVALELTSLASFQLIAFDGDASAKRNSTLALLTTSGSSLFLMVGTLLIALHGGTTRLDALPAALHRMPNTSALVAGLCLTVGTFGKGAQLPFHFWLPRAMVAPTPVSAYLHSAALVAAGLFAAIRVYPVIAGVPAVARLIQVTACATILVGSALALSSDRLKHVLAYSTIAQFGYGYLLLSLGGEAGALGAVFFIFAHGCCKCALFLIAGALKNENGIEKLSEAGGLAHKNRLLATLGLVAVAGLSGFPATVGFFKDELLFYAAKSHGMSWQIMVTAAAMLTTAYAFRFWVELFWGKPRDRDYETCSLGLSLPIAALVIPILVVGLIPESISGFFEQAAVGMTGREGLKKSLVYHFEFNQIWLMSVVAWSGGVALVAARRWWTPRLERALRFTDSVGAEAFFFRAGDIVRSASDWLRDNELKGLKSRMSLVALFSMGVVFAAVLEVDDEFLGLSAVGIEDSAVLAALCFATVAVLNTLRKLRPVALIVVLSVSGFTTAILFSLLGAGDVALVLVLVETVMTLLLLALVTSVPQSRFESAHDDAPSRRARFVAIAAGVCAFFVALTSLTGAAPNAPSPNYAHAADKAHARDIVTAILTDFRGLDTAVEVTVFAVAVLGAAAVTRSGAKG